MTRFLRRFHMVAVLASLWLMSSAQAAPFQPLYTTAQLQALCASPYDIDVGLCAGYIMAVADQTQRDGQSCISGQIGPETMTDNIRRAWAQSPRQPDDALSSVQEILHNRFPCR